MSSRRRYTASINTKERLPENGNEADRADDEEEVHERSRPSVTDRKSTVRNKRHPSMVRPCVTWNAYSHTHSRGPRSLRDQDRGQQKAELGARAPAMGCLPPDLSSKGAAKSTGIAASNMIRAVRGCDKNRAIT